MGVLLEEINRMRRLMNLNEMDILNEGPLEDVQNKFVGENKPISEELFNEIKDVTNNSTQYIIWLIKKIVDKIILSEDVYKYTKYFQIFEKYKLNFPKKNIHDIKTKQDIQDFIDKSMEIDDKINSIEESGDKENYVSVNEIEKLKNVGIKFLGVNQNYQVFEVPNELKNSKEAYETYKTILGRCKGRETGEGIEICTIASFEKFKKYLTDDPGSSYFVMFNKSDPDSPYQFHFESKQFMNRSDKPLL
jgi:hypothetical protein